MYKYSRITAVFALAYCFSFQSECFTHSHNALAEQYANKEDFEKAIEQYQIILAKNPQDVDAIFALASIYLKIGQIDKALDGYNKVVLLIPHNPVSALYNLGYTLKTAGYLDDAIAVYEKVINISPSYDPAWLALGFAYLNKGDFVRGWDIHQRYLRQAHKNADVLRLFLKEKQIAGKSILCTYEGGVGDTLMFIRYVEVLKHMGAQVFCAVQKSLVPLLSNCPYIDRVFQFDKDALPTYDAFSTLMSLPAVFNSTEDTIPRNIPYIYPDPDLVKQWSTVVQESPGLNIGLCWQADVHNDVSRLPIARRGIPLTYWFPLLSCKNVSVYSLQRFDGTEQIADIPRDHCSLKVFKDFDITNGDFMDTAALIENLDLIISVDTAVAHLAGALGKPVILLLPYAIDWRWIYGRTDTPWYPTMTIFKQLKPFDWQTTLDSVYDYLKRKYKILI